MSFQANPDHVSSSDRAGTSISGGPLSGRERTSRLVKALPEERSLWKALIYFPFSATWDEEQEKKAAVEHTHDLFVRTYTEWYLRDEMNRLRQHVEPSCSVASAAAAPHNNKRPSKNNKRRRYYDPEDDQDDGYGYDDQDDYANTVAQSSLRNEEATRKRLEAEATKQIAPYLAFLKALPDCEPLTAGFMLLPGSSQKCCFCPCSRRLSHWRSQSVLWNQHDDSAAAGGQPPHAFRECDKDRKATVFHAPGLLSHVKDLKKSGDWWHWIIGEYLNRLFLHYMGPNLPHKALLPMNSREVSLVKAEEQTTCRMFYRVATCFYSQNNPRSFCRL